MDIVDEGFSVSGAEVESKENIAVDDGFKISSESEETKADNPTDKVDEEVKSEESTKEKSGKDTESLLDSFVLGEREIKADEIAKLVEWSESDAAKILSEMSEEDFDKVNNQFKFFNNARSKESRAEKKFNEAQEIRDVYDKALERASTEFEIPESLVEGYPEFAEAFKEQVAVIESYKSEIAKERNQLQNYMLRSSLEIISEKVEEFKSMTPEDIQDALKDTDHESHADAVILNNYLKSGKYSSGSQVAEKLNNYYGRYRSKAKADADDKIKKDVAEKTKLGFRATPTTSETNLKKNQKKIMDGSVQHATLDTIELDPAMIAFQKG